MAEHRKNTMRNRTKQRVRHKTAHSKKCLVQNTVHTKQLRQNTVENRTKEG